MAEGAVYSLLAKLGDPLLQEAALLRGVRDQMDWLLSEMRWMESFLKVADARRRGGDVLIKTWVREVKEAAHRAEDILDTFMLEIEPRARLQRRIGGAMGSIVRYAALPFELIPRHEVGAGIQDLRARIEQIKASRERYGLVSLPDQTATGESSSKPRPADDALQASRRISPHLDDDDTFTVGLEFHTERIMEQLLDPNIKRRCVTSVVGTGGLGKTTLATKVYNSKGIKAHFGAWAWVSVSEDYRVGELVKKIAKQVMAGTSTMDELEGTEVDDLKVTLRAFLKERRYLIVLDDVWGPDVWAQTKAVLPEVKNGSRVLLTTRSTDVARSADPRIPPYQLPFLNKEDSWELLLKNAFPENQDAEASECCCPKELEGVGRQLVRKCGGLPLALLVLGGLLSRKDPSPAEWASVAERMDWASTQDGEHCLKILGLSYDDLPHHHLRSCFLYLSAFPEDWEIYTPYLISLWIAEGFIPPTEARTVEETARAYLEELAQRSMIQVINRNPVDNSVARFRLHDLFLDLCIREAREDGFLNVYGSASEIKGDPTLRRIALHNLTTDDVKNWCPLPNLLRSILVFRSTKAITSELFNGLKLLRVIHLEGINDLASSPEEMKSMIHLRYLRVTGGSIRELPSTVGNLCNLQTLDVSETNIKRLPKALGKIQMLRHLRLSSKCVCPPNVISKLANLQTLYIPSASGGWVNQRDLEKLVNIRLLGVSGLMASEGKVLLHSLPRMRRLSSLEVQGAELISAEFFTIFSNHNHLLRLRLDGPVPRGQLPSSHSGFPPNLTALRLGGSKLEQDPMPTLEKLPNLRVLRLYNGSYVGKELVCTAGGFPRLDYLYFDRLKELEHWRVECGAMRQLVYLYIGNCSRLRMLPEGLQHVASLHTLNVYDEREEFRSRLQRGVGEDWYKVRHVSTVRVEQRLAGSNHPTLGF